MAKVSTNDFKNGLKVMIDGDPCSLLEHVFVKPGKGQAFVRVKLRNLRTDKVWERTFKSGESLDIADVINLEMQFLYADDQLWYFMAMDGSYEQYVANATAVARASPWISAEDQCTVTLFNGAPLAVEPPNFVNLAVTDTDPGLRGDTASGGTKPATLATGSVVKVPLFIEIGEVLKIDTRSGAYISRC